jgi:hypothetical protein
MIIKIAQFIIQVIILFAAKMSKITRARGMKRFFEATHMLIVSDSSKNHLLEETQLIIGYSGEIRISASFSGYRKYTIVYELHGQLHRTDVVITEKVVLLTFYRNVLGLNFLKYADPWVAQDWSQKTGLGYKKPTPLVIQRLVEAIEVRLKA